MLTGAAPTSWGGGRWGEREAAAASELERGWPRRWRGGRPGEGRGRPGKPGLWAPGGWNPLSHCSCHLREGDPGRPSEVIAPSCPGHQTSHCSRCTSSRSVDGSPGSQAAGPPRVDSGSAPAVHLGAPGHTCSASGCSVCRRGQCMACIPAGVSRPGAGGAAGWGPGPWWWLWWWQRPGG